MLLISQRKEYLYLQFEYIDYFDIYIDIYIYIDTLIIDYLISDENLIFLS